MPIIMNTEGMCEEAKKNTCTVIGKEVCASHVAKVWEAISDFIIQNLCNGRAVKIPGLATITFKVKTAELSHKDVMVQKIPHVILAAEIEKRHGLKQRRPAYNLDIPEVDLNLSSIAIATCLSRAHVEHVVNEVIAAFNRAILTDPQVEFWLPRIARVVIECADVNVVFCTEFLNMQGYVTEYIQDRACPLR